MAASAGEGVMTVADPDQKRGVRWQSVAAWLARLAIDLAFETMRGDGIWPRHWL